MIVYYRAEEKENVIILKEEIKTSLKEIEKQVEETAGTNPAFLYLPEKNLCLVYFPDRALLRKINRAGRLKKRGRPRKRLPPSVLKRELTLIRDEKRGVVHLKDRRTGESLLTIVDNREEVELLEKLIFAIQRKL